MQRDAAVESLDAGTRRERAIEYIAELMRSPRVRAETINAVLTLQTAGAGTLVLHVPRQMGRAVDASFITGGLQLRLFEDREIA